MKNEITFDPDNIPFTAEEMERTHVLRGRKEFEAARKVRRAQLKHDLSITEIMNKAFVPGYDSKIIPDDYDMPILTDAEASALIMLDPDLNSLIIGNGIAIRRKIAKDWQTAQYINKRLRYERDNYGE